MNKSPCICSRIAEFPLFFSFTSLTQWSYIRALMVWRESERGGILDDCGFAGCSSGTGA